MIESLSCKYLPILYLEFTSRSNIPSTGRFYHGLGNVKASQGLLEESFNFHRRARDHYRLTIGRQHHRTADANVRLADHFIRKNDIEGARYVESSLGFTALLTSTFRELLNKAVQAYSDRGDIYYPEKSRALYKRHKVQVMLGKTQDARCDADASLQLHRQARPEDQRPFESLKDEDFDSTIVFWSR